MFKIDNSNALILINDVEDVYKIAKALADIDELVVTSDKDSSEFFDLVFAKDNSRVIVADRQKLKEILVKKLLEKHPEITEDDAEEQANTEIQNMEEDWDVDFNVNLGPTPGEEDLESESEEEGLASEEEVSQIEQQLEQESETEEEEGLLSFADEIKTMFEKGAGIRLLYKPNGKNLTIVEVTDNGIIIVDEISGTKGLLSNKTLNERSDQFDIL